MKFEIRPPHIFYYDETPHRNVALKVGDRECVFDGSASSFDDANSAYRWAFVGQVQADEKVDFLADGRSIASFGPDGATRVSFDTTLFSPTLRDAAGKEIAPAVEQLTGGIRILVGAGPDAPAWSKNGWLCNDLAEAAALYSDITIVGPCWALPVPDNSVDEIMARGMIEHMTYHEVLRAFAEWMRVLKPGGFFTGEVPDVDEYIREYLKMRAGQERGESYPEGTDGGAEGEPADREACIGINRWLRRALWGWQRWPGDEHRSGWDEKLFRHYLEKCGASRVEIRHMSESFEVDDPQSRVHHLWARAWK